MTNPIQYLQSKGFVVTSDPNHYYQSYNPPRGKKPWGKRDLMSYGINADAYCGGYHRAYDMAKYHDAPIPAIANATVLRGTGFNTFGYTLVLGFKDAKGRAFQVIYGHLNRNPLTYLRIGQNVKQGQTVAYQGASNNLGVSMASHLHIQFQNYQAYNEWNFTCLGIDPLKMDISKSSPTSGATPKKASKPKAIKKSTGSNKSKTVKGRKSLWKKNKHGTWYMKEKATFTVGNQPIVARHIGPFLSNPSPGSVQPKTKIKYDEVMLQDGHVWIGYTLNNGKREYLPIRTWNGVAPNTKGYSVGALWGNIK